MRQKCRAAVGEAPNDNVQIRSRYQGVFRFAHIDRVDTGLRSAFATKIATAAKFERTILVDGWAMKIESASLSEGTAAKTSGDSGSASAA